jgi:hypothetical protein
LNRLWTTERLVCHRLLNGSALVLLVQPEEEEQETAEEEEHVTGGPSLNFQQRRQRIAAEARTTMSTVASALGFYRVPTIGINIRDTEFSRKVGDEEGSKLQNQYLNFC